MTVIQRPPRTAAHATRDDLLRQFREMGLTPTISTNGGDPHADIECIKGAKPGELRECWLKPNGIARLQRAELGETV